MKKKLDRRRKVCKTLQEAITFEGIGVHSGIKTALEILPSEEGITFMKKGEDDTRVEASIDNVLNTFHGTTLGNGKASFEMVEHLLGTLFGLNIDCALILLERGNEIPILDGSALPIVEKLKIEGKLKNYAIEMGRTLFIQKPFTFNYKKSFLGVYPSKRFIISYFISYEKYPEVTQMRTVEITPNNFIREIAPARTYAFLEWVEPLKKQGLIKGGSLENSLVYTKEGLLNKSPLRFADECVRHKILDFLGDLSLLRRRIIGHFVILCGGHTSHIAFLKQLKEVIIALEGHR